MRWFAVLIFASYISFGAEARVDAKSNEILNAVGAGLAAAKSAELELRLSVKTTNGPTPGEDLAAAYTLVVERPNKFALVLKSGTLGATIVCDGTNTVTFIPEPAMYTVQKAAKQIGGIENAAPAGDMGSMAFITALFSNDPKSALLAGVIEAKYVGREKIGEADYDRIDMKQEGLDWRLFTTVGEKPMVRCIHVTIPQLSLSMDFSAWKLNAAIPRERFAFTPPVGARKVARLLDEEEKEGEESDLVDEAIPKLKLKTVDGETFETASLKGRVSILVVWSGEAEHCLAAIQSAAELTAVRKGVGIYSINIDEKPDRARIKTILGNNKSAVKTALDQNGQVVEKFEIEGVPTTFLIDKEGIVRKAFLGYHAEFPAILAKDIDALLAPAPK